MPYQAKTLSGATRRVRQLERIVQEYEMILGRMQTEQKLLAKLAATGPAFHNPLHIAEAVTVRDRVLKESCRLNPDGSPIVC